MVTQLDQLAEVFRFWRSAHQACAVESPRSAESPLVTFVDRRLADLERTLLETGFQPDELAALTAVIEDDATALAEVRLMACESRKQVGDILNEVRRRWTELPSDESGRAIVEDWGRYSDAFLKA